LAHYKKLSLYIIQRAVHLSFSIWKDSQPNDFVRDPGCFYFSVTRLEANQKNKARANGTDRSPVDGDLCRRHPLQDNFHEWVTPL
jgi:hypothetical protein